MTTSSPACARRPAQTVLALLCLLAALAFVAPPARAAAHASPHLLDHPPPSLPRTRWSTLGLSSGTPASAAPPTTLATLERARLALEPPATSTADPPGPTPSPTPPAATPSPPGPTSRPPASTDAAPSTPTPSAPPTAAPPSPAPTTAADLPDIPKSDEPVPTDSDPDDPTAEKRTGNVPADASDDLLGAHALCAWGCAYAGATIPPHFGDVMRQIAHRLNVSGTPQSFLNWGKQRKEASK